MSDFEYEISPDGGSITIRRAIATGGAYECTFTLGEVRSLATMLDTVLETTKQEGSRRTDHPLYRYLLRPSSDDPLLHHPFILCE